jgi:hypothetical protein
MQSRKSHRTRPLTAVALIVLAALLLVACGGSSTSSTASSTTSSATTKAGGNAPGGRFTALRECLKKEGITLPQRVPGKTGQGAPPPGSAAPFAGQGPRQVPPGVSRAKFEAAMKKCGGGSTTAGGAGATGRLHNPTFTKALTAFATCMRQNGVNVPSPNTSGKGPIFSTKGLDTGSAKFRTAQQKCSSLLNVARPGGQGGPPGAQPPAGG